MLKRITIFTVAVALSTFNVYAGTPKIVINKGKSDQQAIAFSDIERINFVVGGLEIQGDVSQMFEWSDIATLHFDMEGETDGVANITIGSSKMRLFEFFSLSGVKVLSVYASDIANIDKSSLAPNIYIVKDENQSFKYVKQ